MRDLDDDLNWVLASYSEAHPNRVELVGQGGGGLPQCLACCAASDRRAYWGGLRVIAVDSRRGVVSRRPKFVFFYLAGPRVAVRSRTRGLLDMGAVAAVLQEAHLRLEVEAADELSEESIVSRLLQAGGAHKPNGWDFGDGHGLKFEQEW